METSLRRNRYSMWMVHFLILNLGSIGSGQNSNPVSEVGPPPPLKAEESKIPGSESPVNNTQSPSDGKNKFNLDGLLIEGRKSKVDALVDLKALELETEEILYLRSNFDDYAIGDLQFRPIFAK